MIRSYFMDFENGIVKIDEEAFSPKYSFEMFRHSSFFIRIKLVHLITNGEEIITTDNHPFYVQGRGFINAGNLLVGDKHKRKWRRFVC